MRKLMAVMFTDITGYTGIVQQDEEHALDLVARHRQVLTQLTSEYGGKVIQFYGDGSLSIYESAIDAVRCAIEMQKSYRTGLQVPVRIGIHLGDIVIKDDTVFGDGVNVASRIESQGIPGAVLISSNVHREIANHREITTSSLGLFELKNVRTPVEVFAVTNDNLAVPAKRTTQRPWSSNMMRLAAILAILIIAGYTIRKLFLPARHMSDEDIRSERIAVLPFSSSMIEDTLLGYAAAHWITRELIELPNARVISYESATQRPRHMLSDLSGTSGKAFSTITGAINVLDGAIFQFGDSMTFSGIIKDLHTGNVLQTFATKKCPTSDPMQGITQLSSEICGWWASREYKVFTPPEYGALQHYLRARAVWRSDYVRAEQELQKAISADPSFMDPYFLFIDLFNNTGRYAEMEVMLDSVRKQFTSLTPRQQNMYNYYEATIRGENIEAYRLYQNELEIDPRNLFTNTTAMVLSSEYINAPGRTMDLFHLIPVDSLNLDNCDYCITRIRLGVLAQLALGKRKQALQLAALIPASERYYLEYKIKAFAAGGDTASINHLLAQAERDSLDEDYRYLYYFTAREFALQEQPDLVEHYVQKAIRSTRSTTGYLIRTLYLAENYTSAMASLKPWLEAYPDNPFVQHYAGLLYAQLDSINRAARCIDKLDSLRQPYQYGWIPYYQAGIYLQLDSVDMAIAKLKEALAEGLTYTHMTFENDPGFMSLHDDQRFQELVHPVTE